VKGCWGGGAINNGGSWLAGGCVSNGVLSLAGAEGTGFWRRCVVERGGSRLGTRGLMRVVPDLDMGGLGGLVGTTRFLTF